MRLRETYLYSKGIKKSRSRMRRALTDISEVFAGRLATKPQAVIQHKRELYTVLIEEADCIESGFLSVARSDETVKVAETGEPLAKLE